MAATKNINVELDTELWQKIREKAVKSRKQIKEVVSEALEKAVCNGGSQ